MRVSSHTAQTLPAITSYLSSPPPTTWLWGGGHVSFSETSPSFPSHARYPPTPLLRTTYQQCRGILRKKKEKENKHSLQGCVSFLQRINIAMFIFFRALRSLCNCRTVTSMRKSALFQVRYIPYQLHYRAAFAFYVIPLPLTVSLLCSKPC